MAECYTELRGLIHSGTVVRADRDDELWVHGIVSQDASEAIFSISAVALTHDALPAPVRLPGLDHTREYRVRPLNFAGAPRFIAQSLPPWLEAGGAVISGQVLQEVGIAAPPLAPEQTLVLHLEAL